MLLDEVEEEEPEVDVVGVQEPYMDEHVDVQQLIVL
jgi:hypothetical protein